MRLLRGRIAPGSMPRGAVVTIGKFDGLHRGHREVLARAAAAARGRGLPLATVSFEPLPDEYFAGTRAPARLARFVTKWHLLQALGTVETFACLRFDRALAGEEPETFVEQALIAGLGVRELVVGEEFRFGRARRGDVALLARLGTAHGFVVSAVAPVCDAAGRISSSRVRGALADNRLEAAAALLGRPYQLWGRVVAGERRGRDLGFPTANLALGRRPPPLAGVYLVRAVGLAGGARYGMANVGERPAVGGGRRLLEVHFPQFAGDLYGCTLGVEFLAWLRAERNFDARGALTEAIRDDVAAGERWLRARGLGWSAGGAPGARKGTGKPDGI